MRLLLVSNLHHLDIGVDDIVIFPKDAMNYQYFTVNKAYHLDTTGILPA